MKKWFMILFMVFIMIWAVFPEGKQEAKEGMKIVLAIESDRLIPEASGIGNIDKYFYADYVVPKIAEKVGAEIEIVPVRSDDNTEKRLRSMVRAGLIPNVYQDYGGRVGLFANPDDAIALNEFLGTEINDFYESARAQFTKDGVLYAIPLTSWTTTGHVCTTLLKRIGMEYILDDGVLTYDELEAAGPKLKELGDDYYITPMFANQAGGDYWVQTFWLTGHGGKIYNTDGTVAIDSPEVRKMFERMLKWQEEGWIPNGASALSPGDYIDLLKSGRALAFSYGYTVFGPDPPAEPTFIPFAAPVIEPGMRAEVAGGSDAVMVFNTGTKAEQKIAFEVARELASVENQEIRLREGRFASRYGVPAGMDSSEWLFCAENAEKAGYLDMGIGKPFYAEVRAQWFKTVQNILTGEKGIDEAVVEYYTNAGEAIERSK